MALDAAIFVELQKVRDILSEDSFTNNKVIGSQVKLMQDALKEMSSFFGDASAAANKESTDEIFKKSKKEKIKILKNKYLGHLYSMEDSTELFALRITRQRKRLGFLANHALFLKKFTACKMLSWKLERIQRKIKELNDSTPSGREDAGQGAKRHQQNQSAFSSGCSESRDAGQHQEEEKEKDAETGGLASNIRRANSSPRLFSDHSLTMLPHSDALLTGEHVKDAKFMSEEEPSINRYKHKVTEICDRLDNLDDWIISVVCELRSRKNMAHAVYENREIKNRFKAACAWVTIFDKFKTMDILLGLLKQVKKSKEEQDGIISEGSLKDKLMQGLMGQRYLIVLDGVRSLDQWGCLKDAFPNEHNGSKIILTTCVKEVALFSDSKMEPHIMRMPEPKVISQTSFIRDRVRHAELMCGYSYNEEELSIIGYKLRNRLENVENVDDRIITIVGELGSGKTMLARAVYGNRNMKNLFKPACAWVTIFKESATRDILHNLLKQVEKSKEQKARVDEDLRVDEDDSQVDEDELQDNESLKRKLSQELGGRRYLIVLDGVQSLDQWKNLTDAFPDEQNGSKIIVTTCDNQVAIADSKTQPHIMRMLDAKESWALFLSKVGLREDPEGVSRKLALEEGPKGSVKERIIKLCRGLPLNIVLLGSLLSTKEVGEWTSIIDSLEKVETPNIVKFSCNDLDQHSKLCLSYMTLFPKESDIPVRRLQRLWLAEGFVKQPDQNQDKFQEDEAQLYFENLVKRSLIMVPKLRSDGNPRKCHLLGVLHDHLSSKARDISLFHVHSGSNSHEVGPFGKRRLIEYAADGQTPRSSEYKRLRSYISFYFQEKDIPAEHVGTHLSNMIAKGLGLLRVLDLEGVYKPSLPENLGDLFHLRYLGLRWTFLDKLPKSVGELPYLETLDLKHTNINKIPPSIWKLKKLRHLNLNEVYLEKDTRWHLLKSLPKLLTLWGLSVNSDSPVKNGLSKLTHLRELGVSFRCEDEATEGNILQPQFTDLLEWISELKALRSLRLRSKYDSGCPANLSLKSFSGLNELSQVNLCGKLQKLPDLEHFPPHIKVLTLSVSHLGQDPMPILGQLPDLTVLRLLANSYLGQDMVCPSGSFQNLEVLKLWMLKDLKKWEVEEGAMKKLKELNIRCCFQLENIPSRVLQQKNLKELILDNMPQEFKENVKNNQFKVPITVRDY